MQPLTPREAQVYGLAQRSDKEIAEALGVAKQTVAIHFRNMRAKGYEPRRRESRLYGCINDLYPVPSAEFLLEAACVLTKVFKRTVNIGGVT